MGLIDWAIIGTLLISALFAFYRGLVRELLGLLAWIGAAFGGFYGLVLARPLFRKMISNPTLADIIAAVVIAFVILVVFTIINSKINEKLRKSVLSGLDRTLGLFFGVLRGALLVILIYFLASFAMPEEKMESYQNENMILPYVVRTIPVLESLFPSSMLEGLKEVQTNDDKTTVDTLEVKVKPDMTEEAADAPAQQGKQTEAIPYDDNDLNGMNNLLESLD